MRINELKDRMRRDDIDGLFISSKENVRYLSGFTGDDSYLLITKYDEDYFITDARYIEQAYMECDGFEIVDYRSSKGLYKTMEELTNNINTLGFEGNVLSYDLYDGLQSAMTNMRLKPLNKYVEVQRFIKDINEIESIRKACEISEKALSKLMEYIKPGVSEKEAACELEYLMKKLGADGVGFQTILLSGSRTSLLHGIPSDRKIHRGHFLLIDFGAKYNGYICDMTRTFVVGKASDKQREGYSIVRAAQEKAILAMKDDVLGSDVYKEIDSVISPTPYAKYAYPGVGHGVGLSLHEEPFISPTSKYRLKKNNIVTIEPGIYIPSWGGIRIEDMILIKEGSNEIITNTTKELIEL